jgi:Zn-dependent protease with chaperone function
MIPALQLQPLAQIAAERLLNSLAAGLVIASFAGALLRALGRRESGTRFAVWFCALLGIALTPFVDIASSGRVVHSSTAGITVPRVWALYLFAAWAGVALFGLMRLAAGLWHLRKIRQDCTPLDLQTLDPVLRVTLAEFRPVRAVELCVSATLRVPTAIGFAKPAVVFPTWALRDLSTTELNTVLLHELAHLRRWDDWTNLAQKALRALFFFHPAVWWVESRLALEREMACDDMVLAQTANPRAYAACLVSLAERNLLRRGFALAQAAVGRMRQTSLRILRILDARAPHAVRVWKPAPWVVGAFSLACLVSSAHAPKLLAFGDASPKVVAHQSESAPLQRTPADLTPLPNGPVVVQASYHERIWGSKAIRKNSKQRAVRYSRPVHEGQTKPFLVRTRAPIPSQAPGAQQAVFVIMEGQRYGDAGAVLWRVSVWRLTVDSQGSSRVVHEIFARSI